jgi:hypothetical protein
MERLRPVLIRRAGRARSRAAFQPFFALQEKAKLDAVAASGLRTSVGSGQATHRAGDSAAGPSCRAAFLFFSWPYALSIETKC